MPALVNLPIGCARCWWSTWCWTASQCTSFGWPTWCRGASKCALCRSSTNQCCRNIERTTPSPRLLWNVAQSLAQSFCQLSTHLSTPPPYFHPCFQPFPPPCFSVETDPFPDFHNANGGLQQPPPLLVLLKSTVPRRLAFLLKLIHFRLLILLPFLIVQPSPLLHILKEKWILLSGFKRLKSRGDYYFLMSPNLCHLNKVMK